MKQRLKIQIDAPHIEEYHDVLYYVQQQIDMGFTGGSGAGSEFFSRFKTLRQMIIASFIFPISKRTNP